MDLFLLVLVLLLGVPVVVYYLSQASRNKSKEEFQQFLREQQEKPDKQNDADALARTWLDLKACFPFLETPQLADPTPGAIAAAAIVEIGRHGTLGRSLRHPGSNGTQRSRARRASLNVASVARPGHGIRSGPGGMSEAASIRPR